MIKYRYKNYFKSKLFHLPRKIFFLEMYLIQGLIHKWKKRKGTLLLKPVKHICKNLIKICSLFIYHEKAKVKYL